MEVEPQVCRSQTEHIPVLMVDYEHSRTREIVCLAFVGLNCQYQQEAYYPDSWDCSDIWDSPAGLKSQDKTHLVVVCWEPARWNMDCCYRGQRHMAVEMVAAANRLVFVGKVFVTDARAGEDPMRWSDPPSAGYLSVPKGGVRASEDLKQWLGHPGTDRLAASLIEWQCRSVDRLYSPVQVVDRIDHRKAYDLLTLSSGRFNSCMVTE